MGMGKDIKDKIPKTMYYMHRKPLVQEIRHVHQYHRDTVNAFYPENGN
jgi:hypothetical protein